MRIMLDTNVLISLLLFPNQHMNQMMDSIFRNHTLVLSSFVVDELKEVTERKFPSKTKTVDRLLHQMSYELVYTPTEMDNSIFSIRDKKDYPVLYTAISEGVDILITGDKDFSDISLETPKIMTPSQYYELFCS